MFPTTAEKLQNFFGVFLQFQIGVDSTILRANGNVLLNLYLLQEDHESVDVDLFTHTAQTKIHQRLQAGEFPGIPEQHIYRGRIYNGCVVKDRRILKICNNDTKKHPKLPKIMEDLED